MKTFANFLFRKSAVLVRAALAFAAMTAVFVVGTKTAYADTLLSTTTYVNTTDGSPLSSTFTAPAGTSYIIVKAWGAGGGEGVLSYGGAGAFVIAQFNMAAGQTATITGGAAGAGYETGGSLGGGTANSLGGAGGGGYTKVVTPNGTVFAAGGGGGGNNGGMGNAGAGGEPTGQSGANFNGGSTAGGGATQGSGGAGGTGTGANGYAGTSLQGGASGITTGYAGGGGGGGYYGGGGGASGISVYSAPATGGGPGGGGSSIVTGSPTSVSYGGSSGSTPGGTSDPNYPASSDQGYAITGYGSTGGTYWYGGNGGVVILAYQMPIAQTISYTQSNNGSMETGPNYLEIGQTYTATASGSNTGYVGGWVAAGPGAASFSGGVFTFTPTTPGVYSYQVYAPANSTYAQSNTVTFTCYVAADPTTGISGSLPANSNHSANYMNVGQSTTITATFASDSAHGDYLAYDMIGTSVAVPGGSGYWGGSSPYYATDAYIWASGTGTESYTFSPTTAGVYTFYPDYVTGDYWAWVTNGTSWTVYVANPPTGSINATMPGIQVGQTSVITATVAPDTADGDQAGDTLIGVNQNVPGATYWNGNTAYYTSYVGGDSDSYTFVPTTPGVYVFTSCAITTNNWAWSNVATTTVNVSSAPTGTITAGASDIEIGQSTTVTENAIFDDAHGGNPGNDYVYIQMNGSWWATEVQGTSTSGTFTPSTPGTYTFVGYAYTYNVSGGSGWEAVASTTIHVAAAPTGSISASPTSIYFGQSTTINQSSTIDVADGDGLGYTMIGTSTNVPGATAWGGFGYQNYIASTETSALSHSWSFSNPPAGTYTFYADAYTTDTLFWQQLASTSITVLKTTPTLGNWANQTKTAPYTIVAGDLAPTATNPYNGSATAPTGSYSFSIVASSGFGANSPGPISAGTVLNGGTYTMQASYPGDSNYAATTIQSTWTVNLISQVITYANPGTQIVGANVPLNATVSSGLTPSYAVSGQLNIVGSNANVTGVGSGTITVTQAGNGVYLAAPPVAVTFSTVVAPAITSPATASGTVNSAFSFSVTASGNPGPTFSATGLPSWATLNGSTGAITGTPNLLSQVGSTPVSITATNGVNATQTLTITIVNANYTLTTAAGTGGSVTSGGTYAWGSTQSFTATPSAGYRFGGWSISGPGTVNSPASATTTVTIGNGSATLTASFVRQYVLTVTGGGAGGTVSGGGTFDTGSVDPIVATPNAGYRFGGWSTSNSPVSSPMSTATTVTLTGTTTVTATFVQQFVITVTAGAGGSVTGGGTYDIGTTVTVTATPSAGYRFGSWGGANVSMLANASSASTTLVATQNASVSASFVQQGTLSVVGGAGGTVTGSGIYDLGTVAPITVTTNSGYVFSGWTGGGATVANPDAADTTVTIPAGSTTVVANFVASSPTSSGTVMFANAVASGIPMVTATTTTRTAVIANPGDSPLTLSSVTTTGDFSPAVSLPLVIGGGASSNIVVTFAPTAVGTRTGVFTAIGNDPASPVLQFNLQGLGANPAAPAVITQSVTSQALIFPSDVLTLNATAVVNTGTVAYIEWEVVAPDGTNSGWATQNGPAATIVGAFPYTPTQVGIYTFNVQAMTTYGTLSSASITFTVVQGLYTKVVNAIANPPASLQIWFTPSVNNSTSVQVWLPR